PRRPTTAGSRPGRAARARRGSRSGSTPRRGCSGTDMRTAIIIIWGLLLLASTAAAQQAPEQLTVAMYAPAAAFSDSSARLAYIQGLAKAIQTKTGVATSGKIYVRLGDLVAAKPDFAIIDGQCLAAHSPGQILASAVVGGDTSQGWGLYTRGG